MAALRLHILSKIFKPSSFTSKFCTSSRLLVGDIESRKIDVNGVKLHYEKTGKGDHCVLLLPGALGSSRTDFGPQLEKFNRDKFTLYAFDPRGFGKSRPPDRDWPLNFYNRDAEDAVNLIKALELSRVSLIGWSDGGNTALIVAGTYPDICRKLVVFGSNSYVNARDVACTAAIEDIDKWSARMKQPFLDIYGEEYFRKQWTGWVKAYHRIHQEKKGGDICLNELSKITCPTLIIHGQKDALVEQEHPDHIHQHIKQSRLVNWPEGKHNLHLRYADEFNKLVEEFLSES